MLHALIQSKFATLEEFVEEYHLHGSAMPFFATLEKFVEARAWRQPGLATMDVAAQVCGVDDLTEATVKEVREGIERAKNSPPQSLSQSLRREQVASLLDVCVTRNRKENMEKKKQEGMKVPIHERAGKCARSPGGMQGPWFRRGLQKGRSSQALARIQAAAAPWEHGRHEVMFCDARQNITQGVL